MQAGSFPCFVRFGQRGVKEEQERRGENQVLQVGKSFKKGKSKSQWREGKKIERGSHHRKRVRYILIINFLIKTNILSNVHPKKSLCCPYGSVEMASQETILLAFGIF